MSAEIKTERVLRDVLNSDNLRDFLGGDVVNNAMKWRFLQAALIVLDGHGLLGDPADAVKDGDDDGREAAPLDPSKVKAGDTVTAHVKFENPEFRDFTIKGEVYNAMEGAGLYVGGWPLLSNPAVTLTAHQPAPEPEPELPTTPGSLIKSEAGDLVFLTKAMWLDQDHDERNPSDWAAPWTQMVVIDPAAVDVEAVALAIADEMGLLPHEVESMHREAAVGALRVLGIEATS